MLTPVDLTPAANPKTKREGGDPWEYCEPGSAPLDSPPCWPAGQSAPGTPCWGSLAGSWCSSPPPRPPSRPGSGSVGFPFWRAAAGRARVWAYECAAFASQPAAVAEEAEQSAGPAGLGVGGLASFFPPSFLPSFRFRKLRQGAGCRTGSSWAPPCSACFYSGFPPPGEPLHQRGGPRVGRGWGTDWAARTPSFTEGREGRFGLYLYGASKFLSMERQFGCFACRLEHNFLIHHPQCHPQDKVQRSALQWIDVCSFLTPPIVSPGTGLLLPSFCGVGPVLPKSGYERLQTIAFIWRVM